MQNFDVKFKNKNICLIMGTPTTFNKCWYKLLTEIECPLISLFSVNKKFKIVNLKKSCDYDELCIDQYEQDYNSYLHASRIHAVLCIQFIVIDFSCTRFHFFFVMNINQNLLKHSHTSYCLITSWNKSF